MKQGLSAFFSAVLRIVPQTVFRIRSTAVLAILVAAAVSLAAHAQTSEWAWMGGSSVLTQHDNGEYGRPGVYGTQGQPSAANIPGGRLGAVSWTDKDDNFWLFGGAGLDSAETFGFLNDLWEFDPSTKEWTWVSGSNTIAAFNGGQPGIYGQQGTPAATNTPGSRSGALGWTDAKGKSLAFRRGRLRRRSGDAYGLRRRIPLSAIGPQCPGDIDRYGERHVRIDPAVCHSNTDGELEQNPEITDGMECWRRKSDR